MNSNHKNSDHINVQSKLKRNEILRKIKKILKLQLYGILATSYNNQPYTSLLAFAASEDMKNIYMATSKTTHKFQYVKENEKTAFFIDTRENDNFDVNKAYALTAIGKATPINKKDSPEIEKLYLSRHPQLETFIHLPNVQFLQMKISSFSFVQRFQNVFLLDMDNK